MFYQEDSVKERDPFEEFGDLAASDESTQPEDADQTDDDFRVIEPPPALRKVRGGFSWAGFAGGLAALAWVYAASSIALSYFGMDALRTMDMAMQAGLAALAFGPALLFWLASSAAGEALKARTLASELIRMTQEAGLPGDASETDARRVTETVKHEIETLNEAVAAALDRLGELEASAQRNAALFHQAVSASRENAEAMSQSLLRERQAFTELSGDMREETEAMALSVGRQVRLMREASTLVNTEMSAAEQALERHLFAFANSAAALGDHTNAFQQAAADADAAAHALNGKVAGMLDGLGEATRLTDAARQSAEQAVLAATETAQAVRETTRGAIAEAKRAAHVVRAENDALQEAAVATFAKLTAAAQAAREASDDGQAAAARHASAIEKRLAALAATAATKRAAVAPAKSAQRPIVRQEERLIVANESVEVTRLRSAANAARWSRASSPPTYTAPEPRRAFKGFTGWNNFLPSNPVRHAPPPKPANESTDGCDLIDFGAPRMSPDLALKDSAIDLLAEAGIDLDAVLDAADLDRIARSSQHGAAARRRAVAELAPGAVSRVSRHVKRSSAALRIATQFRARPDLAKAERIGESSDLVRAYLLIDAALA